MAKRFQFRLDPVLKYRERIEDDRKNAFGEAQGHVMKQQQSIEQISTARSMEFDSISNLVQHNAAISRISDSYRYLASLHVQRLHEENALRQLKEVAERKRQEYVEARKKRRALEMLREKRKEEHRYELDREEQQMLDDIALQRFNRQRREHATQDDQENSRDDGNGAGCEDAPANNCGDELVDGRSSVEM